MQIDKNTVMEMLRSRGDQQKADQAQQELPEQIDTDRDAGLLEKFGIDPKDLLGKLGGLGGQFGG